MKIRIVVYSVLALILSALLYFAFRKNPHFEFWPPRLGEKYPNLKLIDQTGKKVELKEFKGKVIIVEPIGMTCRGCNAFAGGNKPGVGGFAHIKAQKNLQSFEHYLMRFGGVDINDKDLVFIHLLLYDLKMKAPTPEDAKKWAHHFGMDRENNHIVLAGVKGMQGQASFRMIPGFHLIDRNFIFRLDSSGHRPKHDLYKTLIPGVKKYLNQ